MDNEDIEYAVMNNAPLIFLTLFILADMTITYKVLLYTSKDMYQPILGLGYFIGLSVDVTNFKALIILKSAVLYLIAMETGRRLLP